jgi:hypothetical protein
MEVRDKMAFLNIHITDDMRPIEHPDRWKWDCGISHMGMAYNEYQLRRTGYKGSVEEYYRQYRFAMNSKTKKNIDVNDDSSHAGIWYRNGGQTMKIVGIEVRVDDNLPDGRVVLIKGDRCVSFDWREWVNDGEN